MTELSWYDPDKIYCHFCGAKNSKYRLTCWRCREELGLDYLADHISDKKDQTPNQNNQPTTPNADLLAAAQTYHDAGYAIVPMVITPEGKKRPVKGYNQWKKRPQTQEEFNALHIENYELFAIICGTPIQVKNLDGKTETVYPVVFDRDTKSPKVSDEAKRLTLQAIQNIKPVTERIKTRSGADHLHLYSRTPVKREKRHDIGMELLSSGDLAIVPPSNGYEKVNDNTPIIVDNASEVFHNALSSVGLDRKTPHTAQISTAPPIIRQGNIRPCFENLRKKQHLSHDEKIALVYELVHTGSTDADIRQLFFDHQAWEPEPDHHFDEQKTRYQLDYTIAKAKKARAPHS